MVCPIDCLREFLHDGVSVAGYDGNGLVALDKPCGVLSHPNRDGGREKSLVLCKYDPVERAYACGCGRKIYLLNRLDSPVSGLILVCLTRDVAEAVKSAFEGGKVRKEYIAFVKGFPRHMSGIWRSRLDKSFVRGAMKIAVGAGVFAETKFECAGSFRVRGVTLSILKLFPITGKTHQLRVHCAQNGLPIVGDETYGNAGFNAIFRKNFTNNRLFLHSREISLSYSVGGKIFNFGAKSALDFTEILKKIRCE
jgi:23S rRNA-/tRNA-specific pseudouridylate synthase